MAQLVMVAHPEKEWLPGKVVAEEGGLLRVLLEDGKVTLTFHPSLSSSRSCPALIASDHRLYLDFECIYIFLLYFNRTWSD
jgi:hypothetical protein